MGHEYNIKVDGVDVFLNDNVSGNWVGTSVEFLTQKSLKQLIESSLVNIAKEDPKIFSGIPSMGIHLETIHHIDSSLINVVKGYYEVPRQRFSQLVEIYMERNGLKRTVNLAVQEYEGRITLNVDAIMLKSMIDCVDLETKLRQTLHHECVHVKQKYMGVFAKLDRKYYNLSKKANSYFNKKFRLDGNNTSLSFLFGCLREVMEIFEEKTLGEGLATINAGGIFFSDKTRSNMYIQADVALHNFFSSLEAWEDQALKTFNNKNDYADWVKHERDLLAQQAHAAGRYFGAHAFFEIINFAGSKGRLEYDQLVCNDFPSLIKVYCDSIRDKKPLVGLHIWYGAKYNLGKEIGKIHQLRKEIEKRWLIRK